MLSSRKGEQGGESHLWLACHLRQVHWGAGAPRGAREMETNRASLQLLSCVITGA